MSQVNTTKNPGIPSSQDASSYGMSAGARKLLPQWMQAVPVLLLAILIATRPRVPIRLAGSAFLVYWYYMMCAHYTTSDPMEDYAGGCGLGGLVFTVVSLLWIVDPMKEWRLKGEDSAPETYPLWKRTYYAVGLLFNQRRIGWTGQVGCASSSDSQYCVWLMTLPTL